MKKSDHLLQEMCRLRDQIAQHGYEQGRTNDGVIQKLEQELLRATVQFVDVIRQEFSAP